MQYSSTTPPNKESLFKLEKLISVSSSLEKILSQFWLPPAELEKQVQELFYVEPWSQKYSVLISGETNNISLYLIGGCEVLILTPFSNIRDNIVLCEVEALDTCLISGNSHCALVPLVKNIRDRLNLPKVLFVTLSVIENFPVPRLSLGVSSLASYVRRNQRGIVKILDMQMGTTIKDIIDTVISFEPNLIGISVSYGQKFLAFELLSAIQTTLSKVKMPYVEVGNIIPASSPEEFLERFPYLLISSGEGERTLLGILKHISENLPLSQVEGLIRLDENGQIIKTPLSLLPITEQPLPALDMLDMLALKRGALTLELSRGCQYNVCSFCPRTHKAKKWKGMPVQMALQQLELMAQVIDRTGLPRRIFLADEEFIGSLPGDEDTERVKAIAEGIIHRKLNIQIDTEARVDQVYNPRRDKTWHIRRMEMWNKLRESALDRLFMGIESGCENQLKRFAKGTKPEQAIVAVRILSSLGIGIRSGFIMFDPLMIGFSDLKENIAFLERTDALLKPVALEENVNFEELYEKLVHDKDFVKKYSLNRPLYSIVSYMLSSLEVLINSPYKYMVEKYEREYNTKLLVDGHFPDTNMGRHHVRYADELVGLLSNSAQRWIDRNFSLSYTIKSLYKSAQIIEKEIWLSYMVELRQLSHFLLKTMIFILDDSTDKNTSISLSDFHEADFTEVQFLCNRKSEFSHQEIIIKCLNLFERKASVIVDKLAKEIETSVISDSLDRCAKQVIEKWRCNIGNWSLINDPCRD